MKLRATLILAALAFASVAAPAQPTLQLTVRSYEELGQAIQRVAKAINPGSQEDFAQQFYAQLGLTNLASFDAKRPWEIALWHEAGGSPLLALKGPIKQLASFKEGLNPKGLLRTQGKEWKQLENGLVSVTFKSSSDLTETEASALKQWNSQPIQPPNKTVELNAKLSEPIRAQAKSLLGFARASAAQTMESGQGVAATGANPKAMTGIINAYFDLLDTFLDGFQELRLGIEVAPEALQFDERITAKAGSELAKWMEAPAEHLTASDLSGLDADALFSAAAYVGKSDSLMKIAKQFTALGLQMQNMETNSTMLQDINALLERVLPVKFTASAYLKEQLSFTGVYTFPGGNAAEIYSQMKKFFNQTLKTQVGEGKMYSAASLTEKHHTIDGVSVDRLSLALNLNNPMFNAPGQKEQMKTFWPDGKLEFDYALKDGKLLLASAAGNQMQALLAGKMNRKSTLALQESPCLAGYMNLLGFAKASLQANPMIPEEVKAKFARMEPQNTSVEFQVSLDKQMHATGRVPLKLLQEMGRLKD
jgi:hypothetical protein